MYLFSLTWLGGEQCGITPNAAKMSVLSTELNGIEKFQFLETSVKTELQNFLSENGILSITLESAKDCYLCLVNGFVNTSLNFNYS